MGENSLVGSQTAEGVPCEGLRAEGPQSRQGKLRGPGQGLLVGEGLAQRREVNSTLQVCPVFRLQLFSVWLTPKGSVLNRLSLGFSRPRSLLGEVRVKGNVKHHCLTTPGALLFL